MTTKSSNDFFARKVLGCFASSETALSTSEMWNLGPCLKSLFVQNFHEDPTKYSATIKYWWAGGALTLVIASGRWCGTDIKKSKGNSVGYFFWNTMAKIRFSLILYFAMIMVTCVFHMVSSKGNTGGIEKKTKKVFKLDHEYLDKGLIPSRVIESPVIEHFGLPGMLHEMSIEIHGGSFQCFYQSLQKDAKFFIYFQVSRMFLICLTQVILVFILSVKGYQRSW